MPKQKNPPEAHGSCAPRLRDQRGQIIGLMSLTYIFITVVFCAWIVNSGQALVYKAKMMNTAVQTAATGAIFSYYGTNYFGWTYATIAPYVHAAAVNSPGFIPSTFVSFAPTYNFGTEAGTIWTVGVQAPLVGFGGWFVPGQLPASESFTVPTAGSLPVP